MAKAKFVSNKDETVELFKNPILEYFSHIHPVTPVLVFVPIIAWMLWLSFDQIAIWQIALAFLGGTILWTFVEYAIHRWAFHYEPKTDLAKRLHFLVHGIHHDYPRDSTRLVMPLLVSLPLAAAFYGLFDLLFAAAAQAIFGGFLFGYVAYDSIHYATHHMRLNGRVGHFLKEYHMKHHFVDESTAYGVSNPLWDYIFGTVPDYVRARRKSIKTRVETPLNKD